MSSYAYFQTMRTQLKDSASYFYLPTMAGRPAEIIITYGQRQNSLHIPAIEQEIFLDSFLHRTLTDMEIQRMQSGKKVRVYFSWEKLIEDHIKFGISDFVNTVRKFSFLNDFPEKKICIQDIFNYKRV